MSTIFSGLAQAALSLSAQKFGLDITQKNIANINTPGYSRQRVAFSPTDSSGTILSDAWNGSPIVSVESFRNAFIDSRVSEELQTKGEYDAASGSLQQVEALLNEGSGQGLENVITSFFNGFDSLANAPEDMTLRRQVLSLGTSLTSEFDRIYESIQGIQTGLNLNIETAVREINEITGRLAAINYGTAAAALRSSGEESTLRDSKQELLDRLASLVDISYFETESGALTVTTRQGSALVLGNESQVLQTAAGVGGALDSVYLDNVDITSRIQSGTLGGLLKVRDQTIPGYLQSLDDLAATLIQRINQQHAAGVDFNGAAGGAFFTPFTPGPSGTNAGAATAMTVAISDPRAIAAAQPGSGPGSNANAKLLAGIKAEMLPGLGGATIGKFYAQFIFSIGSDTAAANSGTETQGQILTQLQNQRDSASGVNQDEEAINIIRYQKAYEASARMVQVWDTLTQDVLNMLGT